MRRGINIFLLLVFTCFYAEAQAQTINVYGSWNQTINHTHLQSGAGSNLVSRVESAADQVTVDVMKGFWGWFLGFNWVVYIHRNDLSWHSDLPLRARRTGAGSGLGGSISGGLSYQPISIASQMFFSGRLNRVDIPVQYEVGLSVTIPPGTYSTTIIYTLTEI